MVNHQKTIKRYRIKKIRTRDSDLGENKNDGQ